MQSPKSCSRWHAVGLTLVLSLSGCASGTLFGQRSAAGEAQIESARLQRGASQVQLVSHKSARCGRCNDGLCDTCSSDGCAWIIPRCLAESHLETGREAEQGCITRFPWRGVGTCKQPCWWWGRRHGHGNNCPPSDGIPANAEVISLSEVERTPAPEAAAKPAAKTARKKSPGVRFSNDW